ncbi:MAG: nucleoside-diphosphate sugar epimerase/dehydratase [Opitutaceae bacterium]
MLAYSSERLTFWATRILRFLDQAIGRSRTLRVFALIIFYGILLGVSFYGSYELRWDFDPPAEFVSQRAVLLLPIVACKLLLLSSFGQFRSVLSYFGLTDFGGVLVSMAVASGIMLTLWLGVEATAAPPRGVILMDLVLSVSALSTFRLALRVARTRSIAGASRRGEEIHRVAIIGAGDLGEAVAKDLLAKKSSGRCPIFFIDPRPERVGRLIHGLPVYGPIETLAHHAKVGRINELLFTLPQAHPKRVREIVEIGRQIGAKTQIVPSFTQLASGEVKIEQSRPVAIEDLLGRAPVNLDSEEIGRLLKDRVVLVTGAGGSIGSELCRQVLSHAPRSLVMIDQAEIALFEIEQELMKTERAALLVPLIADVADEAAIRAIFTRVRPEIIFHAAAHKHVPLMERQPGEAIKNNTLASAGLMAIASEFAVSRFVFISTDKAINPTSVMGCSKRLSEKALQARQAAAGNGTTFMAVRFGNVLGSSGSVIPTFRRQIAQGGPVTVTHPDMTRYFMTIPEAVGLVLQAATQGRGGEIFILDMSQPVKIVDLARNMIELSGYRPDVDIEIKFTGLRPGEKLFEELRHTDETHEPTEHHRIFKLRASKEEAQDADTWLRELRVAATWKDPREIKLAIKRLVPEYTPFLD